MATALVHGETRSGPRLVFEPIMIGNVEVKNRILRTAHGTGQPQAGEITDGLIAYHVRRARGGAGLSFLEAGGVHPSSPGEINVSTDDVIGGYRRISAAVRPFGMKLFQQLWHGPGPNRLMWSGLPAPISASAVPHPVTGLMPRAVTVEEIESFVEAIAAAAVRCREGGLDGVEIHSAHGYLLGSFLSPVTNQRTDAYGGSFGSRLRFLQEAIAAVRRSAGDDFVVGVRLSNSEAVQGGLGPEDVARVVREITTHRALDFVNLTQGTYFKVEDIFPTAGSPRRYEMPASRIVSRATDVPVMVTGRFLTLEDAETVLESGEADMVSMVRALIADPNLVEKTRQGREREIRPCISGNQGCLGGITGLTGRTGCAVNPLAGRESELAEDPPAPARRASVVVVGGGPAGLEAARTAAMAGQAVTLFDEQPELGGRFRFASRNPRRAETYRLVEFWRDEMDRLGVTVRTGERVNASQVSQSRPDIVFVATGAPPRTDGRQMWRPSLAVPGWGGIDVVSSSDAMSRSAEWCQGRSVLVYDDTGHYEAIDVAERLLADGATVTLATGHVRLGARMEGNQQNWEVAIRPHLRHLQGQPAFELVTNVFISKVENGRVALTDLDCGSRQRMAAAQAIVPVSHGLVEDSLARELSAAGVTAKTIGDAAGPRGIELAIYEGFTAVTAWLTELSQSSATSAG